MELTGSWEVTFDPAWFYPDNGTGGKMTFGALSDWTAHADPAIKHYSGIATYRKTFDWPTSISDRPPPSASDLPLPRPRALSRTSPVSVSTAAILAPSGPRPGRSRSPAS